MTNKEAIEILTSIKNTPTITWENGADVAFDLAIKALIAFRVTCELLAGDVVYGIDAEFLHNYLFENNDAVSYITYYDFIMDNLDRFTDIDSIREKAVERLGF